MMMLVIKMALSDGHRRIDGDANYDHTDYGNNKSEMITMIMNIVSCEYGDDSNGDNSINDNDNTLHKGR